MKKDKNIGLFIVIVSFLIIVGGCKNTATTNEKMSSNSHYSEEEIVIPENIKNVNDIVFNENGDILLSEVDSSETQGSLWKYSKKEKQWEQMLVLMELLKEQVSMEGLTLSTQINANGEILCIIKPKDEKSTAATRFFLVDKDQSVKELIKLKNIVKEKKINTITFYDSTYLLATNFDGNSYLVDFKTENIQSSFQVGSGMIQSITGDGKNIVVLTGDHKIKSYDINSGKQIENKSEIYKKMSKEFETNNGMYGKSELIQSNSEFYLVNGNGVSRYKNEDNTIILDGNNTVFGNTDSLLIKAFKNEQNQNIFAWVNESEKNKIFKYQYSKNEIKKKETLTVYSIYENTNVRNMINKFSRANTNIEINYVVGMNEKGSKTESEAIKNLNTEILSNNSPDVIILDGLDEKAYIEKDLLANISSIAANEQLIPAATEGYSRQNKVYAIAMKAAIPIFVQKGEKLDVTNDAQKLVSQLKEVKPNGKINILDPASRYNTISILYRMSFNKENKIDKKSVEQFYSILKDINEVEQKGIQNPEGDGRAINDISSTMLSFESYNTLLREEEMYGFDYLTSIESLRESIYFKQLSIDTNFLEDKNGVMYVPESIIAIPKKSTKKDKAEKFIKEIISKEYQVTNSYEGIPTNLEAVSIMLKALEPIQISIDSHNHTENEVEHETEEVNFNVDGLSEVEQKGVEKMLKELKSMSADDIAVKRLIIDEGQRILDNKVSVDEAVKKVTNKLTIYNSEK
ncbi:MULTISPECIES: hypothetical protein [Carnobacterium]|uniref:hypothetical protein n=1 Tax=Carnobacterium TaxID=2747 RepID=UPI0028917C31|nr:MULTISPECIES: hypothetical protein [Carnobacterium]MDT1940674.1 extracellular solute-binding protein [Carnobacterium divergens]MDT1943112.1 extracellular solute-binding protein [Carnobacterium divergens]MDT1948919.1 extracellular solute-binding protein [Carnobacterium divergens]MDT1951400.1 extracellular solute-binding protein [Carnobacterium divergens]MDT1956457.1 extracellular solute-binding protein [Carnobacterium divergens]